MDWWNESRRAKKKFVLCVLVHVFAPNGLAGATFGHMHAPTCLNFLPLRGNTNERNSVMRVSIPSF